MIARLSRWLGWSRRDALAWIDSAALRRRHAAGDRVVVVCKTDRRSARAAEALVASGVRDVAVLRGGTDGWHRQGLPLE